MTSSQIGQGRGASFWRWAACCAGLFAFANCSVDVPSSEVHANVGTARLALTATANSGAKYRLRNGIINIYGKDQQTLFTEDNLDAAEIVLELTSGAYLAQLQENWSLEKQVDTEWMTVPAKLTSQNPYPFTILDQTTADVVLAFKAGDDVVEMNHGKARILIEVTDTPVDDDNNCSVACAEADALGCDFDEACEALCEDIETAVTPVRPECHALAVAFNDCTKAAVGSSYTCEAAGNVATGLEGIPMSSDCSQPLADYVLCLFP